MTMEPLVNLLLACVALWVLLLCAASWVTIAHAKRISPALLPYDVLRLFPNLITRRFSVRFYVAHENAHNYAYAIFVPLFRTCVVIDRSVYESSAPNGLRWLLAHELAHIELRHVYWRWFTTVTGLCWLPWAQRMYERHEVEATRYAEALLQQG